LAAPGEAVITTYPGNNYAMASGTSFSAPFVSGSTSLLYQLLPQLELSNANKYFSAGKPVSAQMGRLDIYEAVVFARTSPSSP
jgi:subtilisin family serine protease